MAQNRDVEDRRGTIQAAVGKKKDLGERFCSADSFYKAATHDRASNKMNSFILLSLFATVVAGKSPRLKFVVHGRQCCIFWVFCFGANY